jgi:fused signal recognition particle receptor
MEGSSFFQRLKSGLTKSRENWAQKIGAIFQNQRWDEESLDAMEENLIAADLGPKASQKLMDLGVNGVGKTTTIAKLAAQYRSAGKKVLLVAADTFRAAAIEQLEAWAKRVGVDLVKHRPGADPSAVVYDGIQAAKNRGIDVLLIDTAGRLHTKVHLIEELKKIRRVISREQSDAPHETLLVLDATTGQNGLQQARVFKEATDITGIVLTKLDGTAKGGVIVSIQEELGVPVRYVGVGEDVEDLQPFDASEFVRALFEK